MESISICGAGGAGGGACPFTTQLINKNRKAKYIFVDSSFMAVNINKKYFEKIKLY